VAGFPGEEVLTVAVLSSIKGEMQLSLRLPGKSYDPFQKDLEWFEYELTVEGRLVGDSPGNAPAEASTATPVSRSARGKINRKDLNTLLAALDELTTENRPLRFEPYDLNFYFEWSHETPLVYLIVTWFDAALAPRSFDQRFPPAHVGFRFLADHDSLVGFRRALAEESAAVGQAAQPRASTLLQ
jgi:hypothetical protein